MPTINTFLSLVELLPQLYSLCEQHIYLYRPYTCTIIAFLAIATLHTVELTTSSLSLVRWLWQITRVCAIHCSVYHIYVHRAMHMLHLGWSTYHSSLVIKWKIFFGESFFVHGPCPNLEGIKFTFSYKFRRPTIGQNFSSVCTNRVAIEMHSRTNDAKHCAFQEACSALTEPWAKREILRWDLFFSGRFDIRAEWECRRCSKLLETFADHHCLLCFQLSWWTLGEQYCGYSRSTCTCHLGICVYKFSVV